MRGLLGSAKAKIGPDDGEGSVKVLIACEFSGIVREAFARKGHDAWSCDLLNTERVGNHIEGNVLDYLGDGWDLMIAHPPCNHLASSGARWFPKKRIDGRQAQGIAFFLALANAGIPKIAVENPVGIMSSHYRKPDQIIQPWQFGHPEPKATCLWLKGLPALIPTKVVEPDYMRNANGEYYRDKKGKRYSRIHFMSGRMSNSDQQMTLPALGVSHHVRWKERSRTYAGIADAMAEQWG